MKDSRVWAQMAQQFGRQLTNGEIAAMMKAMHVTPGGAQKKRRAMRRAAYSPLDGETPYNS